MTLLIYGIIGFTILSGLVSLAFILSEEDDDYQQYDWWRDQ